MLVGDDALLILLGALVLDAVIGDPPAFWRRIGHPVAWFGGMISLGERWLNRGGEDARRAGGIALLAVLLLLSGLGGLAVQALAGALWGGDIVTMLVASVFLAQRSLHAHVAAVGRAFASGGLTEARKAVAQIVGRDPERLDEAGVVRAAIESAAENFPDGVVAPAFWFALLGLPGLIAYKAVNTADSMIGHLSPRYRAFGWAAARTDDGLNWLPARLAGALVALAAPLAGGSPRRAFTAMARDAARHRSPNAGWPEAAMAGGLGLALAGPRFYASGPVDDPFLNGDGRHDANPADIARALRVIVGAALLHGMLYLALVLAF